MLAAASVCAINTHAIDRLWTATGDANWNTPGNWLPAQVPGAGDIADIVNADPLTRTVEYDYTGPDVALGELRLSNTLGGSTTLVIGANTLSAATGMIGQNGNGIVKQSGGAVKFSGSLSLAPTSGSAAYQFSGGTLAAADIQVGGSGTASGGTGALTLTGGVVTVAGPVKIWNNASTISISSSTLSADTLDLPVGGPATMLSIVGGLWRHTGASATMNHDFTVNGATLDIKNASSVLTLGGNITGPGYLVKTGAGSVKLTGSVAGAAGFGVFQGNAEIASTQTIKSFIAQGGSTTSVTTGTLTLGNNVDTSPLNIADAKVDLTSRGMVIDIPAAAETDTLSTVRSKILDGYNGGTWQGNGIVSSVAKANSTRGIGYARASDIFNVADATPDAFMGASVDANAVVARMTLLGDATLDGVVDFNDLVKLAQNYNTTVSATTGSWWNSGDFTYDGIVDFNDLVKLAQNYNTALPSAPVPGASANFNADWAAAIHSVPEPTAMALLIFPVLIKRRRKTKPA